MWTCPAGRVGSAAGAHKPEVAPAQLACDGVRVPLPGFKDRQQCLRAATRRRLDSRRCGSGQESGQASLLHVALACVDEVIRELVLWLPVLLSVEEGLRLQRPVVLPLQGCVVQAHVVKSAVAGTWLPIPVVLPPLEPYSSGQLRCSPPSEGVLEEAAQALQLWEVPVQLKVEY